MFDVKRLTLFCLLLLSFSLILPLSVLADDPQAQNRAALTRISLDFERLPQGQLGMVSVNGAEIVRVRAAFLDLQYEFWPQAENGYTGLIAAPMDAALGEHRLSVLVFYADGESAYFAESVRVSGGGFASVDIEIPTTLSELLDRETFLDEYNRLEQVISAHTIQFEGETWQQDGLSLPLDVPCLTAVYGTFRRFNGWAWQRHTGIDYGAPVGTPIMAAAAGEVVMLEHLPIRGQYLLLDHGGGLFTGYAHLSEALVNLGDTVQKGDIIGAVGNTGRSTGAHLHWEAALSGNWIDPLQLMDLIAAMQDEAE